MRLDRIFLWTEGNQCYRLTLVKKKIDLSAVCESVFRFFTRWLFWEQDVLHREIRLFFDSLLWIPARLLSVVIQKADGSSVTSSAVVCDVPWSGIAARSGCLGIPRLRDVWAQRRAMLGPRPQPGQLALHFVWSARFVWSSTAHVILDGILRTNLFVNASVKKCSAKQAWYVIFVFLSVQGIVSSVLSERFFSVFEGEEVPEGFFADMWMKNGGLPPGPRLVN